MVYPPLEEEANAEILTVYTKYLKVFAGLLFFLRFVGLIGNLARCTPLTSKAAIDWLKTYTTIGIAFAALRLAYATAMDALGFCADSLYSYIHKFGQGYQRSG